MSQMSREIGSAFYRHSLDLAKNVDPAANRLRNTYDGNLREKPPDRETKGLRDQNAALRREIAKLKGERE